jgi:hypothetical protein
VRRTFAILFALPLTFALLPLGAVVMSGGSTGTETTLVVETGSEPAAPAAAAAWDAHEFDRPTDPLAFRSPEGPRPSSGECIDTPQS